MRRFVIMLAAWLCVGSAASAQAGTVSYQFINRTSLSFDYSLQLANATATQFTNHSYLGKEIYPDLTSTPSIWPQQASPWQSYTPARWDQKDAVAFNMRTGNGTNYGLLAPFGYHACGIPSDADGVNMQFVLEDRGPPGDPKLVLIEYTPDGNTCEFRVAQRVGPVLWGGFGWPY